MSDQLVRVHLPFRDERDFDKWAEIENYLEEVVEQERVGMLDGNEIGQGEYTIWLYGPDADRVAEVVKNALAPKSLPPECYMYLRKGSVDDESAEESTVRLT
jgi:hypothetical protein